MIEASDCGNNLWAKLSDDRRLWLSLIDHSADVAAVFEAILRVPTVSARLARLAKVRALPETWRARLCVHVALHDFGKANHGFQARRDPNAKPVGHVGPGLGLMFTNDNYQLADRLSEALCIGDAGHWGAESAPVLAVAAHHGRALDPEFATNLYRRQINTLWAPRSDYDPIAALEPLGKAVQSWFPSAFEAGGPPLPDNAEFWHAFAGLVMLADWIGSDTKSFPLYEQPDGSDRMEQSRKRAPQVLRDYGFDPEPKRKALPVVSFASISKHQPRPVQLAVAEAEGQVVILEAETGSGKTEAALYRFARLFEQGAVDGLYFALPTRVAAKSLYDRIRAAVDLMWGSDECPSVILAVPGYAKVDGISGKPLPGFEVLWDDDPNDARKRERWAAEHPKRFLAGTIAVGTIDQALLGAIKARHSHMRAACLHRHLLVVDEVHSSDVYMERLLTSLLAQHTRSGGHALLLSATLGSAARQRLLGQEREDPTPLDVAKSLPYPAISTSRDPTPRLHAGSDRAKNVRVSLDNRIAEPEAIAALAITAAEKGAKVLIVRNLHRTAVATAETLFAMAPDHPALFRCKGVPTLHHGRFAREDRELLDAEIETQMKSDRATKGLILVGTQTLEQSLDICADLLITDICPADVLLQRIGRLHRHAKNPRPSGFEEPRAIVLAPPSLEPLLARADFGLGGAHGPYRDLVMVEATRGLVERNPIWCIPTMNRQIVEEATHPYSLDQLVARLSENEPRWLTSRQDVTGNQMADAQQAAHARLKWTTGLSESDNLIPDEERVGTRLGSQDLVVTLPEGTIGPFDREIRKISIPSFWWNDKIDLSKDLDIAVSIGASEISFSVQGTLFTYNHLGLMLHRS